MQFSEKDLVKGNAYFILLHADEDLKVPVIQTLIFNEKHGRDEFHFTQIKSDDDGSLFVVKGEHLEELVVDRAGLIERLCDEEP
ncbi:MAG: hypothetical protein H0T88_11300 [Lysobacter sp.]|nr:hypothetical protein [Lysobacter sp.]